MTEPLEPQRWEKVQRLFQEALGLPPGERERFLDDECREDPALRVEVASLLAASATDLRGPLEAVGQIARSLMGAAGSTAVGTRLGAFRLEEEIGRGGMGVVYRGVRVEGDFQQTVAVKVLPGAVFSSEATERFRNERRILAGLEHPNVARLLDGGTTPEGVPFVIMEFVDGRAVDRYADEERLGLEDRIWLFLAICDAVAYAHRNLVVHRDLKPSNILVTRDGTPKLLDFGIAKLLDPAEVGAGDTTGTRVMTPRFASPEQLLGRRLGTPTDVYSLGLVLYRLLAGVDPRWEAGGGDEDGTGAHPSPAQVVRRALETEPHPPSRVSGNRRLAGDLDTVVLEALRRDPEERYASVGDLAQDLRRYLTGQPVSARPPSAGYRFRKFVGRNRVPVGLASLLFVTVAGFGFGMGIQARQLARERDVAEDARRAAEAAQLTSERSAEFLVELFREADPERTLGEEPSALDLLSRGTVRAREELAEEPVVLASVLDMIGRVHRTMAQWDEAHALLDEARRIRLETLGPRHPDYLESLLSLGLLERRRDNDEAAVAYYREALEGRRALHGEAHETVALLLSNLGVALGELGRRDEAVAAFRQSVAIWDSLAVDEAEGDLRNDLNARNNLATAYSRAGQADSAVSLGSQVLERRERLFGGDHPDVAVSHNNLALFLMAAGRRDEALPHLEESLAMRTRIFGADHPTTLTAVGNIGLYHAREDRPADALPWYRRAVEAGRASGQPRAQSERLQNLTQMLLRLERWEEADPVVRESIVVTESAWGPDDARMTQPLWDLATLRRGQERWAEMEDALWEAFRVRSLTSGPESPGTGALAQAAGVRLAEAGRVEAAREFLDRALVIAQATGDPEALAAAEEALAALEQGGPAPT